ncbi:MAG: tetratricopeptide repeat protein [Candidatus Auribacterota bacterium]
MSKRKICILTVVLLMVILRIIYFIQIKDYPGFSIFLFPDDQEYYDRMAREFSSGSYLLSEVNITRGPGYIYFLGLIYKFTANSALVARIIQFGLGVITGLMVIQCGTLMFGGVVGILAGFLYSLYLPIIAYEAALLMMPLIAFLVTAGLWLFFCARRNRNLWLFALSGICFGWAFLCRPNSLILPFVLAVSLLIRKKHRICGVLFLTGTMSLYSALIVRNIVAGGDPLNITTQGEIVLLSGHWHDSDGIGWYRTPNEPQIIQRAGGSFFRFLSILWSDISSNIPRWATKQAVKTYAFFLGYEFPQFIDVQFLREVVPLLRLRGIPFGVLSPLALIGVALMLAARKSTERLFVVYFVSACASVIIFYIIARFRQPFIPLFCIAGGYCIARTAECLKLRYVKRIIIIVAVFALLVMALNSKALTRKYRMSFAYNQLLNRGNLYLAQGDLDKAEIAIKRSLRFDPASKMAAFLLGVIEFQRGKYNEALAHLTDAWMMGYETDQLYKHLAMAYHHTGELKKAVGFYKKSLEVNANQFDVWNNLATAYMQIGTVEEAVEIWQKNVRDYPDKFNAYYNLACYYANNQEYKRAHSLMREAERLKPGDELIHEKLRMLEKALKEQ